MTCPGKYMVKREQIHIWKSNYIPFLHTVESIAESLELIYTLPLSRVFTGWDFAISAEKTGLLVLPRVSVQNVNHHQSFLSCIPRNCILKYIDIMQH